MEKVINYLEGQSEFSNSNIQRFREEVAEFDRKFPQECIWESIASYIDNAGGNNDQFLTLFEENYKDLCSYLFNTQYELLDDFQNSDSDGNNSDRQNYEQEEKYNEYNPKITENYGNNSKMKNFQPASYEGYGVNDENFNFEENIYDNDQEENIQDRCYNRRNRDDSNDIDKQSNNDSSYDPLDTTKIKESASNSKINNIKPDGFPMMINSNQIKGMHKFMMKPTFDPRLLNQNHKMMQMMAQNHQMSVGMMHGGFPMIKPIHINGGIPIHMIPTIHQRPPQIIPKHQAPAPVPKPEPRPPKLLDAKGKHNISSIFVKNIPLASNNIGELNTYFTQFGPVTNITVNTSKSTAVIKFSDPAHARAAYMSPTPVLSNPSIQLVYNPGSFFNSSPKASAGENMVFESEEAKKHRESLQKKRNAKKERKELLEKNDQEFKMMIKELNEETDEEKRQAIKDKIGMVKKNMVEIKKQEEEERKEGLEKRMQASASKGLVSNNKYVIGCILFFLRVLC